MTITDDEKNIFRESMHHVKPLDPTKHLNQVLTEKPASRHTETRPVRVRANHSKTHTVTVTSTPSVTGNDTLSFCGHGLQHKKFTQLKQGKLRIEATLDLHEHTRDTAIDATHYFLTRCQNSGFRVVCIIHGKGLYCANDQPVIKNLLNSYLRSHASVLAFHSAQNRDGGTGALYVLIKST